MANAARRESSCLSSSEAAPALGRRPSSIRMHHHDADKES